jgi:hypothetical protein
MAMAVRGVEFGASSVGLHSRKPSKARATKHAEIEASTPAPLKSTRMRHPALLPRFDYINEKLIEFPFATRPNSSRRGRFALVAFSARFREDRAR